MQHTFSIRTNGRGMINITSNVEGIVQQAKIITGLCHVFLHHTSASLILCENADPTVQEDLETFMKRIVPEDNRLYKHTTEGTDDMPSHIRSVITKNDLTIPITKNRLDLGTWQGIYIWEHRLIEHERRVTVTVI